MSKKETSHARRRRLKKKSKLAQLARAMAKLAAKKK
jgi:hypothetical protein